MSNTMITDLDQVHRMIPQKPPMAMIDSILYVSEQKAITALSVHSENIFCTDGCLQAPGIAENIAQTAAAQAGYLAKQREEAPPVGFIGAIKNLEIIQLPKVGEQLKTEIIIEHQIMNFTLIKGLVKVGDQLIAQGYMKIFIADQEPKEHENH